MDVTIQAGANVSIKIPNPPGKRNLLSFGDQIAIARNGRTLLVSATGIDGDKQVLAYERNVRGEWHYIHSLERPDDAIKLQYGESIAISADGRIAAVAVPGAVDDVLQATVGGVVIYHFLGGRWRKGAIAKGSEQARYGRAIAAGDGLIAVTGSQSTHVLAPSLEHGWVDDLGVSTPTGGSVVVTAGNAVVVGTPGSPTLHLLTPIGGKVDPAWSGIDTQTITLPNQNKLGKAGLAMSHNGDILAAGDTLGQTSLIAKGTTEAKLLGVKGRDAQLKPVSIGMNNDVIVAQTATKTIAMTHKTSSVAKLVTVRGGPRGATAASLASGMLVRANGVTKKVAVTPLKATSRGKSDVFVRDNFDDDGNVPTRGTLHLSPDIICRRAKEIDPATAFVATGWRQDFFEDPKTRQNNYIYARVHNRGSASTKVKAHVYSVPAASFISHQSWEPVCTIDLGDIGPGQKVVNREPFIWRPTYPENVHRCFVIALGTTERPFVEPSSRQFAGFTDWGRYVMDNNWLAFHNSNITVGTRASGPSGAFDMLGLPHHAGSGYKLSFTTNLPLGAKLRYGFATDASQPLSETYAPDGLEQSIDIQNNITLAAGERKRFRFVVDSLTGNESYAITFTQSIGNGRPMGSVRFSIASTAN